MADGAQGEALARTLAQPRRKAPRLADLEAVAGRRIPGFCFGFLQSGSDAERGRPRNVDAFARVEIVPRDGADMADVDTSATVFGHRLAAPILLAPVGIDGAIWPGATRPIAEAARDTGLGCMAGTLSCMAVEDVARILPGLWFQLLGFPDDDDRISLDLARRAAAAGVKALAVTVDTPLPVRRIRDMRNGIALPFRLEPRMALDALRRPAWLAALARSGMPRFWNAAAYCPPGAGPDRGGRLRGPQPRRIGPYLGGACPAARGLGRAAAGQGHDAPGRCRAGGGAGL
jgi:L-lactate dehydrogenase (cytochrome)